MSAIAAAEVDRAAVVEDDVAIGLAQLDLFLRSADLGLGHEDQLERLIDMRRHRLAGDHAILVERGDDPALGVNHLALPVQHRPRFEPAQRLEAEPLGDRAAFGLVGDELEQFAVADLLDAEMMGKAVGHESLPSISAWSDAFSSRDQNSRSAVAL